MQGLHALLCEATIEGTWGAWLVSILQRVVEQVVGERRYRLPERAQAG